METTQQEIGKRTGMRGMPKLRPLQFGEICRSVISYHRGAFWRLLAALQIQLNRSPSSTPARQRFSLAGLFRFCSRRPAPPYHVAI